MAELKNMSYVPIEDLLKKVNSSYKLVILASRRTMELNEGGQRLVDLSPRTKISTIALEEIKEGKIGYEETENEK